jgi:lysine 6-dehydrogenase
MGYHYAVLGAGKQGQAIAFDLAKNGNANSVCIFDLKENIASIAKDRLNKLLDNQIVTSNQLNVKNKDELTSKLKSFNTLVSAVPYFLNELITEVAIENNINMIDLGGNTKIVKNQLSKNDLAIKSKIAITPDCGMGPGMNITLSLLVMEQFDDPKTIKIYDGGLPQQPEEPWNYNLFFNINGLTNEYDGCASFIRNGKIAELECFEDIESLDFENYGQLEASVTSGGLSTMPWTFLNQLITLENKTLRYPGHWKDMIAYRNLGLFDLDEIKFNNQKIIPREFYHHLLTPKLEKDNVKDVCLMRIMGTGVKNGQSKNYQLDAIELFDDITGFTAMEKWTGWHASIVAIHITKNKIIGAIPVEKIITGNEFLHEAKKRNFNIKIKEV